MIAETKGLAEEPRSRWSKRRILFILVPLFLYWAFPVGFWPLQIGANSSAHAYLSMAVYLRGETCVDTEVRDYNYNHDLIYRDGHYYSNKPPGPAMWLIPATAAIDLVSSGPVELIPLLYFGRLLMLTLVFVVFLFFLGRALERFAPPVVAWGLVLAYALGTNAGVYATLYVSHDLAAMGLITGFLLLLDGRPRWCWIGGLAAGFAVVCEYQAVGGAIVLAILSMLAGGRRFNWRTAVSFGLGALPMAVFLLLYNQAQSGTMTELAYQTEFKHFELETTGTLGFGGASASKLWQMAFSPGVGLFMFSPWLLLAIPAGVAALLVRSAQRRWLIGALAAALALTATIAMHDYWVGGAIAGPRYLTASLPFYLFPIAAFLAPLRGRWRTVTGIGATATVIVAVVIFAGMLLITPLVNTEPDKLDLHPFTSFLIPLVASGMANLTVANVLGAGVKTSLAIHVLLLLIPLTAFLIPWWRAATRGARLTALPSVALAGALFLGWLQLGTPTSEYSKFHIDRSRKVMNLATQPKEHGRVRFVRRLEALNPPRRFLVQGRPLTAAGVGIVPEQIEAEELVTNFKLLFDLESLADGSVLLSDMENNTMHRYTANGELLLVADHAGARGAGVAHMKTPGVSGITLDREGRLVITQNGYRKVSRIEPGGELTSLADRFDGKCLNSPRGPVVRSDGTLFFTDPPFGLSGGAQDPKKELKFSGIYRWRNGELTLVHRDLEGPGALAFSPDEKHLYVTNWEPGNTFVVRFDVDAAGDLHNRKAICRIEEDQRLIPTCGLVVDRRGHIFVTANMRVWILSPEGNGLVMLELPSVINGLAWGGPDGRTLYLAGHLSLYRMRLTIPGHRP